MPRALDPIKVKQLVGAVERLSEASFRNVLKEAARGGIIRDHKTLRVYLDLLVAGGVLKVHTRDVGSVYRKQIYSLKASRAKVWVGIGILRRYGLNWDAPLDEIRPILTDFEGLARSRDFEDGLMGSLEDCLVDEIHEDAKKRVGTISLVIAMISTRKIDLLYLLRRADQMRVGRAARILFRRILEIVSSNRTDLDAATFLAVREHFLRIVRQYAQTGFWKTVEVEVGVGELGLSIVNRLNDSDVIVPAAKQLGVIG